MPVGGAGVANFALTTDGVAVGVVADPDSGAGVTTLFDSSPTVDNAWLLEDGVSFWLLEDGVSYWLLES